MAHSTTDNLIRQLRLAASIHSQTMTGKSCATAADFIERVGSAFTLRVPDSLVQHHIDYISAAASTFGVSPGIIADRKRRSNQASRSRWAIWHAMRQDGFSFQECSDAIRGSGTDHTTVIDGTQRFAKWLERDEVYIAGMTAREAAAALRAQLDRMKKIS